MFPTSVIRSRAFIIALLAVVLLGAVLATRMLPTSDQRLSRGAWFAAGCDLPLDHLRRIRRGFFPRRSPEITIVPKAPHFVGFFGFTTHAGPWGYVQRVPLLLYGPGFITPGEVTLDREVTVADIAPTIAELLDVSLPRARPGRPILDALVPPSERARDLRLVVTVVWDGGGWNVLNRWPAAWPHLRKLMRNGALVRNVTVGSSPSSTPAVHSTIGTGAWPARHGVVDIPMRRGDVMIEAFDGMSPKDLLIPSLADLYDRATGNEAKVGMVAEKAWHLGMLGRGALHDAGDKDVSVMWNKQHELMTNRAWYSLPDYLPVRPVLREEIRMLDAEDGQTDSAWMGREILDDRSEWRVSPLWTIFQPRLLKAIVRHEEYGQDHVPDLLFTNFKHIDVVGHWTEMVSELRATVRHTDDALRELTRFLDRRVGKHRWVLAFTADHGLAPDPRSVGAWPIEIPVLTDDLAAHFGVQAEDLVQEGRPTGLWLSRRTMREHAITVDDVAEVLVNYRLKDNVEAGDEIPRGYENKADDRLFAAVFPSNRLDEIWECARDS